MRNTLSPIPSLAFCAGLIVMTAMAQDLGLPPDQPFQAVHLISVQPTAEKALLAAFADINMAIATAGCPQCAYHLWKVSGTQTGVYNYLQISSWPGREVYLKVHNSAEFNAAGKKHPEVAPYFHAQVYNRYVEVTSGK